MAQKVTRKDFLKTAGLATTGAVFGARAAAATGPANGPIISPQKASKKVNLALIGIANQGASDARQFINSGLANIVAVCDVDLDAKGAQDIICLLYTSPSPRDS